MATESIHSGLKLDYKIGSANIYLDNSYAKTETLNYKQGGNLIRANIYVPNTGQTQIALSGYYEGDSNFSNYVKYGTSTKGGWTQDSNGNYGGDYSGIAATYLLKLSNGKLSVYISGNTEPVFTHSYVDSDRVSDGVKVWLWLVGAGGAGGTGSAYGGGGGGAGGSCLCSIRCTSDITWKIVCGYGGQPADSVAAGGNGGVTTLEVVDGPYPLITCFGGKGGAAGISGGRTGGKGGTVVVNPPSGGNRNLLNYITLTGGDGGDGGAAQKTDGQDAPDFTVGSLYNDYLNCGNFTCQGGSGGKYSSTGISDILCGGGGGGVAAYRGVYGCPGIGVSYTTSYENRGCGGGGGYVRALGGTKGNGGGFGFFTLWCS